MRNVRVGFLVGPSATIESKHCGLFAPDSALAGKWPINPIASDSIIDYVRSHDKYAAEKIDSDGLVKYFESSLSTVHKCSVTYKINMCDVYHTR
jgi:hypothetical protein